MLCKSRSQGLIKYDTDHSISVPSPVVHSTSA